MTSGVLDLMKIQIVNGDSYLEQAESTTIYTQTISAPRGQIVDASGEWLVSNKSGLNVVLDKAFFPSDDDEINRIIITAIRIFEEEGVSWNDSLPITTTTPFEFEEDSDSNVAKLRTNIGVQVYGDAIDCMNAMIDNYGISDEYTEEEARAIAGVRYTMYLRDFSISNSFTLAEDIPMSAAVKLKELTAELDGVDIVEEAVRVNNVGDVVPHLIGTVGAISAEEYEELKDNGYQLSDSIGKGGIESAMEDVLKGTKGVRTLEIKSGQVIADEVTEEAVPGNSIKLTIDSDFQREVQTILENHIYWLQNQTSSNASGTDADAGAIVVIDVNTGALLAAATYPTYNLLDYIEDYTAVASGENSPLTNRATSGLYRPGSTFKTVTATAALNEGIIDIVTTVTCNNVYTYWEDWTPKCTGFHGSINVMTALKESCNIFFYEIGRITGIDTIAEYASLMGLGEEMGLEIGRDVKKGYIATPDSYEERGQTWQAGNVVQAAIGQADTYITPLQMAAQAMTIANKGVRYQTYMVDSVYDYSLETLLYETEPVIAAVIEDKTGYTFDTVTKGMIMAGEFEQYTYPTCEDYYTDSYLLTDLEYSVAIKTGTPQMTSSTDTGSAFIGFYPADDPQIAFAGFIEHGDYSKFMIKEIIQAYYDSSYTITALSYGKSVEEATEELAGIE